MTTDAMDDRLTTLRSQVRGTVSAPGDPGYELTSAFNSATSVRPRAVVAVADAADVAATIRFAADQGLRVTPQRTGHGVTPLPEKDGSDVLLIHTGELDSIEIDAAAARATIGAGNLWGDVVRAAAAEGLAAPCGASPTVGVSGFLTGAGFGPLNRFAGLSSDHVRAFEVVTGDGEIRRATADLEPDLFWGLRGGKATLGIVTSIELDLLPITRFYGGALFFDGADATAVLDAWRAWTADLPDEVSTSVAIMNLPDLPMIPPPLAGRTTVSVRYTNLASPEDAESTLAPIRAVAEPVLDGVREMSYGEIGLVHNDPPEPGPGHDRSLALTGLPAEAIDALLAVAGPGSGTTLTVAELRLLGGVMGRPAAHESAFSWRSAPYNLFVVGALVPPIAGRVPGDAAAVIEALQPWSAGTLPTFAPGSSDETRRSSYDEPTWQRLAALGDRYDPQGVLRVGQVVRT